MLPTLDILMEFSAPTSPSAHEAIVGMPADASVAKSVYALAIQPLKMALSVTGRKAYDIMLWYAQRLEPDEEGGYSCPVSAIIKSAGSSITSTSRLQRYIEQMVQTSVIWRPLSPSEQQGLFDPEMLEPEPGMEGEVRTFTLLSEARRTMRSGQAWVTWFYPPSIRKQLINPERWAQLQISSIAKLSTYPAVALYEICARYKSVPGGFTSRHHPDFWVAVLREGGDAKPMPYRHFRHRMLLRAIEEINAQTEIRVELVEHRATTRGREVISVQFRVEKKAFSSPTAEMERSAPAPIDDSLAIRAAKHDVKESEIDLLVARHGPENVAMALDYLDERRGKRGATPIHNATQYLRTILGQKGLPFEQEGPARERDASARSSANQVSQGASVSQDQGAANERMAELRERWLAQRKRHLRDEFDKLSDEEKRVYLQRTLDGSSQLQAMSSARKRIAQGDWKSPLVFNYVISVYGRAVHGDNWASPSEEDLSALDAQEEPAKGLAPLRSLLAQEPA